MSREQLRATQAWLKQDNYVDYTWSVRDALSDWENRKRLAAWRDKLARACAESRAA